MTCHFILYEKRKLTLLFKKALILYCFFLINFAAFHEYIEPLNHKIKQKA